MTDNNDDAPVTLTLKARDARIMIHTYGYAVSNEANNVDGARGEQLEHLWDVYHDMKSQSSRQARQRNAAKREAEERKTDG